MLLVYPFIFHALALLFSFFQTRPKSYWAPLEDSLHARFPKAFRRRENLAHADEDWRMSMSGKSPLGDDDGPPQLTIERYSSYNVGVAPRPSNASGPLLADAPLGAGDAPRLPPRSSRGDLGPDGQNARISFQSSL